MESKNIERARVRAAERISRDDEPQTGPSSEVIKSEYFVAELIIDAQDDTCAEQVAMAMRMQNSLSPDISIGRLAPVSWECDDGIAQCSIVGHLWGRQTREEWRSEETGRFERGHTVGKVTEVVEELFGCVAAVRPLEPGLDHPEDLKLMDAFRSMFGDGRLHMRMGSYPSTQDLLSAGQQQESLLGTEGSYARKAPFFRTVLVSRTESAVFDRATYSAACKALARATGAVLVPQAVFQREDERWELRMLGMEARPNPFSRPMRVDDPMLSDAIAHYLDAEVVEYRTFGTTAADGADIVEAERIGDEIEQCGVPEPEDFHILTREEVAQADTKADAGEEAADEKTGEEELDELIGLGNVKERILEFVDFAAAQKARGGTMPSLHMWMTGNPGTGKTTLARIIGHLLYDRGLIPKRNVFVEGDRETLVGQFVGHTAVKTKKAIAKARHGVLFIDEAYALDGGSGRDYGAEAIATLVKAMEDCRANYEKNGFVCIMAGYPELMEKMVSVNPGLRDRFGFKLEFEDYSADELVEVFELYARKEGYTVNAAARAALQRHFGRVVAAKDDDFGNARLVRKVFERCQMRQARLFGADSCIKSRTVESVFGDKDIADLEGNAPCGAQAFGFAA